MAFLREENLRQEERERREHEARRQKKFIKRHSARYFQAQAHTYVPASVFIPAPFNAAATQRAVAAVVAAPVQPASSTRDASPERSAETSKVATSESRPSSVEMVQIGQGLPMQKLANGSGTEFPSPLSPDTELEAAAVKEPEPISSGTFGSIAQTLHSTHSITDSIQAAASDEPHTDELTPGYEEDLGLAPVEEKRVPFQTAASDKREAGLEAATCPRCDVFVERLGGACMCFPKGTGEGEKREED